MNKLDVFKSPGISIYEKHENYSPSLQEMLKGVEISDVVDVLGIENVQNYLRSLKLKKIKGKL